MLAPDRVADITRPTCWLKMIKFVRSWEARLFSTAAVGQNMQVSLFSLYTSAQF